MGYQSIAAVTLGGRKDDVLLALSMYKASESPEAIKNAWHILEQDPQGDMEFFAHEYRDEFNVIHWTLCWRFDWVKFYEPSSSAVERLGEIVGTLCETHGAVIGLDYKRVGESPDDYECAEWGEKSSFTEEPTIVRHIDVDLPPADAAEFWQNNTVTSGNVHKENENASK